LATYRWSSVVYRLLSVCIQSLLLAYLCSIAKLIPVSVISTYEGQPGSAGCLPKTASIAHRHPQARPLALAMMHVPAENSSSGYVSLILYTRRFWPISRNIEKGTEAHWQPLAVKLMSDAGKS